MICSCPERPQDISFSGKKTNTCILKAVSTVNCFKYRVNPAFPHWASHSCDSGCQATASCGPSVSETVPSWIDNSRFPDLLHCIPGGFERSTGAITVGVSRKDWSWCRFSSSGGTQVLDRCPLVAKGTESRYPEALAWNVPSGPLSCRRQSPPGACGNVGKGQELPFRTGS